ncbi:hypothetical protein N7G274_004009 [Stereocaulon virgatum]|uniref:RNA ligase domain-containing protein n=1 Tax=Stereocaulon virgatum TaxID=373712 RepID=A0ABR4ADP4_9LECA
MTSLSLTENIALTTATSASKTSEAIPAPAKAERGDSTTLYPKILKLSDFIHTVRKCLPTISSIHLIGSVKLHGTHADIVFQPASNTIRCQSRNRLALIPGKEDNFGCAAFVAGIEQRRLLDLRNLIIERYKQFNPDKAIEGEIVLAGEWCGTGIQKKVALDEIPKFFAIISIKINGAWVPDWEYSDICNEDIRVFHIGKAGLFRHEVKLDDIEASDRKIKCLTDEVEKECPFSKLFGVSGLGEGIVWKAVSYCEDPSFWFKSKGDILAVSHSNKLPASAVDKENKDRVENFAKAIVTEMRMEQGWGLLPLAQKNARGTGAFLKWVINDCLVEEKREMETLGIGKGQLSPAITNLAKTWFYMKVADKGRESDRM